jgi:hypothetical protein
MSVPANSTRADEKLDLIQRQLRSLRIRLNSLAAQHAVFYTLAIAIGVGAIIFAGAYIFAPLTFLIVAALSIVIGLVGIVAAIRTGWGMRASAAFTAAVADDRAELKGRLSTIAAISKREHRGPLWAYLLEDTLALREQFIPTRIERRRISRSIFALAGALMLAVLALPASRIKHAPIAAPGDSPDDLTVDLDDLHLRSADPGEDSGMQVTADPATMRKLQEKLARENPAGGDKGGGNSLNQMMNQARDMAGHLQNKLTGNQPNQKRLNLRLADAGNNLSRNQIQRAPDSSRKDRDVAGQFQQEHSARNENHLPTGADARRLHGQLAPHSSSQNRTDSSGDNKDPNSDHDSALDRDGQQSGEQGSNGGASHGIGADPDTLFGAPAPSKLGTEGFEIAIEARSIDHGANAAGHAYVPPKVRTPLAPDQAPDEPVTHAAVPAQDRSTIKRVFER